MESLKPNTNCTSVFDDSGKTIGYYKFCGYYDKPETVRMMIEQMPLTSTSWYCIHVITDLQLDPGECNDYFRHESKEYVIDGDRCISWRVINSPKYNDERAIHDVRYYSKLFNEGKTNIKIGHDGFGFVSYIKNGANYEKVSG